MIILLALGLARVGSAAQEDAFLDRPVPKSVPVKDSMVPVTSFWNVVQTLGTLSGKTVRLPAELAEWPDERVEKNWGTGSGWRADGTLRETFEYLCLASNLSWSYDPAANVINLQPAWRRDDPRSGKELLRVLLDTRPASLGSMERETTPNRVGGHGVRLDPWRVAFDALLSRPENFPLAGALRLCHDSHGQSFLANLVVNLCAATLTDAEGRTRILVLNGQSALSNKESPGDIAYYLFDEDGRFLSGGVDAIAPGWVGVITDARVDAGRVATVSCGWGSFAKNIIHLHFFLSGDELVLHGSTDSAGVEKNAEETQHLPDHRDDPTVRPEYRFPAR